MDRLSRRELVKAMGVSLIAATIPMGVTTAADGKSYVSKRLCLQGDWKRTQILSTIAFGDGHRGGDVWTNISGLVFPSNQPGPVMPRPVFQARYGSIAYDAAHGFYFVYELEIGDSESRKVSALFRFVKDHDHGVFAAAFAWPFA